MKLIMWLLPLKIAFLPVLLHIYRMPCEIHVAWKCKCKTKIRYHHQLTSSSFLSGANHGLDADLWTLVNLSLSESFLELSGTALELPVFRRPERHDAGPLSESILVKGLGVNEGAWRHMHIRGYVIHTKSMFKDKVNQKKGSFGYIILKQHKAYHFQENPDFCSFV